MKKFFNLRRSKFWLLTFAALLLGGGNAVKAETLAEGFESVTVTKDGAAAGNNYGDGLSNGWVVVGGSIYQSSNSTNYGLWATAHGGSKSLEASYSSSNSASVVITTKLSGNFTFWARKTSSSSSTKGYITLYEATEKDGVYTVTSTQLYPTNSSLTTTWTKYSVDLGDDGKYVAINMIRAAIDDIEGTIYEESPYKKPVDFSASDITTSSVKLSWTAGSSDNSETGWNLQYKKSSDEEYTSVTGTVDNPYSLTGLKDATAYDVQVQAVYSEGVSGWTKTSFTTLVAPIAEYPYTETFNDITSGIPAYWDNSEGTTAVDRYKWSSYSTGHEGKCVRFDSYNNPENNTNFLKTRPFSFAEGSSMKLSFWYKNPTGGDFSVYVSNDGGTTMTELATGLTGKSDWEEKSFVIPNSIFGDNVVFLFKGTSNYGSGDAYIYLDDVKVSEASEPELSVTPGSDAEFGIVKAAPEAITYTVSNTGGGKLSVSIASSSPDFTVSPATLENIEAGESQTFTVAFNYDVESLGSKEADITVTPGYDETAVVTFKATAKVMDPNVWAEDFTNDPTSERGWTADANWSFSDGVAHGKYVYGSTKYYLTTPSLTISAGEEMTFKYKRKNAKMVIEKQLMGGEWTALHSDGSYTTDSDWQTFTISDLEPGTYKFRFANDDYDLDDFEGFKLNMNAPELTVDPTTAADFGNKVTSQPDAITYTITNSGTGTLTGTIVSSDETLFTVSETSFSLEKDQSMTFDISLVFDDNYGTKSADITIHPTVDGLSDVVINATATTKDPNVWEEDFEDEDGTTMPAFWTTSGWTVSSSHYGGNGTKMASAGQSTGTLTTPRLYATAGQVLTFEVGNGTDTTDQLTVEYSNDLSTWTAIEGSPITTGGEYTFTAPADGNYYLRFSGKYASLDNFSGFKLDIPEHIVSITASNIPTSGLKVSVPFEATVTVAESRGVEEEVTAALYVVDSDEDYPIGKAIDTVAANGTTTLTIEATPSQAGDPAEMYIVVTYAGGDLKTETVERTVDMPSLLQLNEESTEEIVTGTDYDLITLYRSYVAGWNTIVLPLEVDLSVFGEGAKAYEFTGYSDGELKFEQVTGTTLIPATPYLLYLADNQIDIIQWTNTQISRLFVGEDAIKETHDGVTFQGTYAPIADMSGNYGVTSEGKIAKGGAGSSIKGFRAYFTGIPAGEGARLAIYDQATGISRVLSADVLGEGVYNLQGQRVQKAGKGLYIVGGKKVVRK